MKDSDVVALLTKLGYGGHRKKSHKKKKAAKGKIGGAKKYKKFTPQKYSYIDPEAYTEQQIDDRTVLVPKASRVPKPVKYEEFFDQSSGQYIKLPVIARPQKKFKEPVTLNIPYYNPVTGAVEEKQRNVAPLVRDYSMQDLMKMALANIAGVKNPKNTINKKEEVASLGMHKKKKHYKKYAGMLIEGEGKPKKKKKLSKYNLFVKKHRKAGHGMEEIGEMWNSSGLGKPKHHKKVHHKRAGMLVNSGNMNNYLSEF